MPRSKYCTGCGELFKKTHELYNHRRSMRCGGRFLPAHERQRLNLLRLQREAEERIKRNYDQELKRRNREGTRRR